MALAGYHRAQEKVTFPVMTDHTGLVSRSLFYRNMVKCIYRDMGGASMEIALSLLIGIGLSATCGFRVFVPFLIVSIASLTGHLELSPAFSWIASYPALITFGTATVLEIIAYFVPYVDNLLAAVSTPAAVIAGSVVTASVFYEVGPYFSWAVAIIAGGGSAIAGKTASAAVHAGSTAASGGAANPAVSFFETLWSWFLGILSVVVPLMVILFLLLMVLFTIKIYRTFRRPGNNKPPETMDTA
jgi:hypothetical protein